MTDMHTPGPWTLEDRGYKFIVHKPGDGYITRDVCRMDSSTMAAFSQEANARLISAAPDLLKALKETAKFLEMAFNHDGDVFGIDHNDATDALSAAYVAMFKAERIVK